MLEAYWYRYEPVGRPPQIPELRATRYNPARRSFHTVGTGGSPLVHLRELAEFIRRMAIPQNERDRAFAKRFKGSKLQGR
jgi:hypothetical protein